MALSVAGIQSGLAGAKNFIATAANRITVKPTGDKDTRGINGFVFDIVADESVSFESDITDHYVEDNFAVQDNIALRPLRISVRGFVGEVVDVYPSQLLGILSNIQSLQGLTGYTPAFTQQATQVYTKIAGVAAQVGTYISQAQSLFSIFGGNSTQATKQQKAYQAFYAFWRSRRMCTVETPFGIFRDMAIESVTASQSAETKLVSDFSVSFKKIRTVKSLIDDEARTDAGAGEKSSRALTPSARLEEMKADNITKGTTAGKSIANGSAMLNAGYNPSGNIPQSTLNGINMLRAGGI